MINGSTKHLIYQQEINDFLSLFHKLIEDSTNRKEFLHRNIVVIVTYSFETRVQQNKKNIDIIFSGLEKQFNELYGDSFLLGKEISWLETKITVSLKDEE